MRNRGINLNTVFISAIKTDRGIIKVGIHSTSEIKTLGGGYKYTLRLPRINYNGKVN